MRTHEKFGLLFIALVAVIFLGIYLFPRGYGKVGPRAYQFATALYSACNQQDAEKLRTIDQMLREPTHQQQLSEQEVEWLDGIIAQADAGDWTDAARLTRQLLEDQVEY